jgi:hypothetical protein
MKPDNPRHAVLIAYAILALIAVALWIAPPVDSGHMAAWVQGVGTLVAVAVAAWVGLLPDLRARQLEIDRQRGFYLAIASGMIWADNGASDIQATVMSDNLVRLPKYIEVGRALGLTVALEKIGSAPWSRWPTMHLYATTIGLTSRLHEVLSTAEALSRTSEDRSNHQSGQALIEARQAVRRYWIMRAALVEQLTEGLGSNWMPPDFRRRVADAPQFFSHQPAPATAPRLSDQTAGRHPAGSAAPSSVAES